MMAAAAPRGRGRGIKQKTDVDFGFGLKPCEVDRASPMEHLALLINNMALEDNQLEIKPVKFAFIEATKTKEHLNNATLLLIGRCLKEERFATCATNMCNVLCDVKVDDLNFRKAFLSQLQATYKQKDEFRKERPPKRWIGFVSLAAQTVIRIRMPDGSPMAPIVHVSLDCILQCLDGSATDEELECGAVQLLNIGEIILRHSEQSKINELHKAVSAIITMARGSEGTRRKLIDGLVLLCSKVK